MSTLDEIKARVEGHAPGPWVACTSGRSGGDHWHICANDEAIAHISANDGYDEEQRQPNAELIAAAPKLLDALETVEALHRPLEATYFSADDEFSVTVCGTCFSEAEEIPERYPCPTIAAIAEALQ